MEKAVTAKQVAKLASYGGMSPRAIRANAPDNRLHALRAWTTGQKTPIATTIATMTTDAVIAKGLTAEKIRGLTPITPVSDGAFLRAWASALEALAEGKTPESVAGAFPALADEGKDDIKAAKVATLTTEQIASRAAKAAASTAKRASKALEDAMALVQSHGRAGTLPTWFITHMAELAKVHA